MHQQRGVALITILIMVALATLLAASIAQHQAFTRESTAYLMRQNQSLLYAKSAETFFIELLQDDAQSAGNVDHRQENWAQPMPAFPVEDGYVTGYIEDNSGKFNLNSLVDEEGKVNETAKLFFEQLLIRLDLSPQLSQAVIDWQDADDEPIGPMGAESSYYYSLPRAIFPANAAFYLPEELRMVRGFEGENYQKILPYVSALPHSKTTININTAPAMILANLHERLDVNAVQQALDQQQAELKHFQNIEDLWGITPFDQLTPDERQKFTQLLGVQSQYFVARTETMLSERKRQFSSHLVRDSKRVYVSSRSMLPFK